MMSMKAKYGIQALLILAREYGRGPLMASDISSREGMPKRFVEQILVDLKRNGIVQSRRGKGGGYYLSRLPSTISINQLIRVLNGPVAWLPCVNDGAKTYCAECLDPSACAIKGIFDEVQTATMRILEHRTLADLVKRRPENIAE